MKRNIRIASAAAAALLAVAPVAANVVNVVNADPATQTTSAKKDDAKALPVVLSDRTPVAATAGTLSSVKLDAPALNAGKIVDGSMSIVSAIKVDDKNQPVGNQVDRLSVGNTYSVQVVAAISGLKPGQEYLVNKKDAQSGKVVQTTVKADEDGYIGGVYFYPLVHVYDGNDQTVPFFRNNVTKNVINDGATVDLDSQTRQWVEANAYTDTKNVLKAAESVAEVQQGFVSTTVKDIADQLKSQGIDVDSKGNFDNSANKAFSITLTGKNPVSGKEVKVVVPFWSNHDENADYPIIVRNNVQLKEGDKVLAKISPIVVKKGDANWNPISKDSASEKGIKALYNKDNQKSYLDVQVVSNDVDVDTVGSYSYTVKATNSLGKTTTLTIPVLVTDANGYYTNVNYAKGYNVLLWHINNDKATYVSNGYSTVKGGSTIFVSNDHKTINGTGYTRVVLGKDNNLWIQDGYLKGSFSTQEEAEKALNNNGEEAVSGVATVHYNGKGGVALLNAEGKYQSQWVTNGSQWKVFAKKTINGRVMYRLGTQSQWIPADYVSVD